MKIIHFFILISILVIFSPWLTMVGTFSSGDWPYLYPENIRAFSWTPEIRFLWLAPYYQILTKALVEVGLSWHVIERLFWFWPFVVLSSVSAYVLTRSMIGVLIYSTNTYALMLVGGGQMGVALSYSLAPLVLHRFISNKTLDVRSSIVNGLIVGVQVMFDPRVAAITVAATLLYGLVHRASFRVFVLPLALAFILHLYWIIPILISKETISVQLGEATSGAVKFLSFATFSQTISLLHPNWPENVFGKVSFMKPEFLVLPLVAFGSLFFVKKFSVLFFGLLALIGAFLAKGAAEPFGQVYLWMFDHVPGFVLFRDATKFYVLVAVSFAFLIPITLKHIGSRMIMILFIIFWLFTIRPAVARELTGTFQPAGVPREYEVLKDFLTAQPEPFTTLWVPTRQRFGFVSEVHPAVVSNEVVREELMKQSVRYVIVPYDSRGELFITDRRYDPNKYHETLARVEAIPWLVKKEGFGDISLFELR